jgi:hypothetical protein
MGPSLKLPLDTWLVAVRVLSEGGPDASQRALRLLLDVESTSPDAERVRQAVEDAQRRARRPRRPEASAHGRGSDATAPSGKSAAGRQRRNDHAGAALAKRTFRGKDAARGSMTSTARELPIEDWYAPHRS